MSESFENSDIGGTTKGCANHDLVSFLGSSRRKSCGTDDGEIVRKLNCVRSIILNEKKTMLVLRIWRAYFVPRVIDCINELSEIPLSRDSERSFTNPVSRNCVEKPAESYDASSTKSQPGSGSTTREPSMNSPHEITMNDSGMTDRTERTLRSRRELFQSIGRAW
jgi:hypothetical protein